METPKCVLLHVLTRLGAGGPPLHAVLLIRELRQMGYETALVTGSCDTNDGDMSYLLLPSDDVYWIPEMSRPVSIIKDLCAIWRLYRLMKRLRPDIVHTHTAKAGMLGRVAALLAGVPVIVHTFHGNVLNGYFSSPISAAVRLLERGIAACTAALCVLCEQQRQEIGTTYHIAPMAKIHVIPWGMCMDELANVPRSHHRGGITVLWLGRLVEIKGVDLLLEVIHSTLRSTENVRFVVAGDGPAKTAVLQATEELPRDRFSFVGWQKDVRAVIARADILIQTSRNEGTPVALIQGMAAGRPFISTAVGGVVDMVAGSHTERTPGSQWFSNGVLVEPTAKAFSAAICELLKDPELSDSMGVKARAFAIKNYSRGRLLQSLDSLYRSLMLAKRPSVRCSPVHRVFNMLFARVVQKPR